MQSVTLLDRRGALSGPSTGHRDNGPLGQCGTQGPPASWSRTVPMACVGAMGLSSRLYGRACDDMLRGGAGSTVMGVHNWTKRSEVVQVQTLSCCVFDSADKIRIRRRVNRGIVDHADAEWKCESGRDTGQTTTGGTVHCASFQTITLSRCGISMLGVSAISAERVRSFLLGRA